VNIHTHRLDGLIVAYLAETLDYDSFARQYEEVYIEELPEDGLSDEQEEWYGAIHEKFSWTAAAPDPEAQRDGWISIDQFYGWLRKHLFARQNRGVF
jgi:hypothetical protein